MLRCVLVRPRGLWGVPRGGRQTRARGARAAGDPTSPRMWSATASGAGNVPSGGRGPPRGAGAQGAAAGGPRHRPRGDGAAQGRRGGPGAGPCLPIPPLSGVQTPATKKLLDGKRLLVYPPPTDPHLKSPHQVVSMCEGGGGVLGLNKSCWLAPRGALGRKRRTCKGVGHQEGSQRTSCGWRGGEGRAHLQPNAGRSRSG